MSWQASFSRCRRGRNTIRRFAHIGLCALLFPEIGAKKPSLPIGVSGRVRPTRMVSQSLSLSKSIATMMNTSYKGTLYSCTLPICPVTNLSSVKSTMLSAASKLGATAKNVKLRAMAACPKHPKDPNARDNRKRSDDYTDDLLKALRALPGTVHDCNPG
jgi:hypothetical protein